MNDKKPEVGEFNAHLSSLVKDKLVTESKITASNSPWFFKIVFPDIPELTGVELILPLSYKNWPLYTHNEIFSCINAKYPEITSPTFNGESYRLQIYLEGKYLRRDRIGLHDLTKEPQNGATVGLRYWPLSKLSYLIKAQSERGVVSGIEECTNADYAKAIELQRAAEDAAGLPHALTQAYVESEAIDTAEFTDAATAADAAAAAAAANGTAMQRAATAAAAAYAHAVLSTTLARTAMEAAGNAADDADFYANKVTNAVDDDAAAERAHAASTAAAAAAERAHATTVAAAAAVSAYAASAADAAAPADAVDTGAEDADDDEVWNANPAVVARKAAKGAASCVGAVNQYVAEAAEYLAHALASAEAADPENRWGGRKPQSKRRKKKSKSKSKTKKSKSKSKRNKRRSYKR